MANSTIKVDSIESFDPEGPVTITYGAIVPSGSSFTVNGNSNIVGVVTAASFVGDGSEIINVPVATQGKVIAFTIIT